MCAAGMERGGSAVKSSAAGGISLRGKRGGIPLEPGLVNCFRLIWAFTSRKSREDGGIDYWRAKRAASLIFNVYWGGTGGSGVHKDDKSRGGENNPSTISDLVQPKGKRKKSKAGFPRQKRSGKNNPPRREDRFTD